MKNRSSVRATRLLTLAALGCIACQFLAGSVALSQPFPSFILDTAIVKGPSLNEAAGTRVTAGDGSVFLTVWVEGVALFGARVNSAGALLDSMPIDITGAEWRSTSQSARVAWSGRDFMVVWTDNYRVFFALITQDGQVTQRTTLQDSTMMWATTALGFDGNNFLACWVAWDADSLYRAQYVRITPDGLVLDSVPRLLVPGNANQQYSVAVYFSGDRYLAAWTNYDSPGLWGTFILPDGTVTDSVGFAIRSGASSFGQPGATHDAHNFVVSWTESGGKLKLGRVTDSGLVLDTAGVLVDSFATGGSDLTSSGDTTLVVLGRDSAFNGDSTEVVAVRVDTALQLVDSTPIVLMPAREGDYMEPDPSVAFAGWGYVAAWCNPFLVGRTAYNPNPVLLRLDLQGHALDTSAIVLSFGPNSHGYPDVASDGTDFLAAWIDTRHDSVQRSEAVCGMRFSQDGTRLDPAGFRISPPGAARPALAFGGGCYLVCWSHEGDVYGARVLPDGSRPDSVPLGLELDGAVTASYPDVAFGDSLFLVVWRAGNMAYGVRVRPDGVVVDTAPKAMQPHFVYGAKYPQVGFDGCNFLVVRNEHGAFYATRVNTAGELLDTTDIVLGRPASTSSIPKIAYGDSVYMVVDSRRGHSWRVSPNGEVLDSVSSPAYFDYAQVVFDGTNFMLLCERDSNNELGAIRITPGGQVLDSTPFLLVTTQSTSASVQYAAMATNNSGRIGLVSRCHESLPYLVSRIRAAAFPAVGISAGHEDARVAPFRALPNPASRTVSLSFGLRQAGPVQVSAFDAAGRRCAVVHSGNLPAGTQSLTFDTRRLTNGVYFLRFEAGADTRSSRLVVSH